MSAFGIAPTRERIVAVALPPLTVQKTALVAKSLKGTLSKAKVYTSESSVTTSSSWPIVFVVVVVVDVVVVFERHKGRWAAATRWLSAKCLHSEKADTRHIIPSLS